MVDFKKRLGNKKPGKETDPVKLYDTLDRAVDKGPLRPSQLAVLKEWFASLQQSRDVIVKLHTGQGKTLIGLLMLQARLNAGQGPAVYLCPNNFLIAQTCEQAEQFGIATCQADPELPEVFQNGEKILVTSVQKLFNGLTKFGLKRKSMKVGSLLMDDAHACSDTIRDACKIRIPNDEPAYAEIKTLFASELEQQGVGTFADIEHQKRDALLSVPYWSWLQSESEVAKILSSYADRQTVKYAWPLLRDILPHCQCVFSGASLEIEPYVPPLEMFGSYWDASHRIFMSATVTDDAFLVKGLRLEPKVILHPLTYSGERWSGEKMVLIPSLIHEDLTRTEIVHAFGTSNSKRKYGHVALVSSFARTKDWESYGALIANTESVAEAIELLQDGKFERTVVLVNRYDGIDLPDAMCRILIFDGRPFSESLIDLYQESCRPNSEATLMRTLRTIEQGMGRSVRGEKDYSAIVITGSDITRLVRDKDTRRFLSPQMATQIEIGLEIAEMAKQDLDDGETPMQTLSSLLSQCTKRDDDWKAFYVERMEKVKPSGANEHVLSLYAAELTAEQAYGAGDYAKATKTLQTLIDAGNLTREDSAWYLQEMARYLYNVNRPESQKLQIAAFNKNRFLLKPRSGVTVAKLKVVSQGRTERIKAWISKQEQYAQLNLVISDILDRLVFGTKADKFEQALDDLSWALGFKGERPDKEWKEGPDNLWALSDQQYIVWECKSEVGISRAEINKREAEQMNRSSAWFEKHYAGMSARRFIVHPAHVVESAAAFTHEVQAVREAELKRLVKSVRSFFKAFENQDFTDMSVAHIQQLLDSHKLSISSLLDDYGKKLKNLKD